MRAGNDVAIKSFGKRGVVFEQADGFRYFEKFVSKEKHFMRKSQSWAIDVEIVNELNKLKVDNIVLRVREGFDLQISLEDFNKHSVIERYKDYEEQCFVHESHWERYDL